jgi:methylmalonyl-CoA mutase
LPKYEAWGDILRWCFAGKCTWRISYASGLYPFKEWRDPSRMFAGEGGPERTNKRFHYVSADVPAKRLSAFDSVTLYGMIQIFVQISMGNW